MKSNQTLQKKLVTSVCVIVTLTVMILLGIAALVEKKRFQQVELERIFYKTDAMKKRLGHLIYGGNLRYLMITLTNAKAADPAMLYFVVTDNSGRILVADDEAVIARNRFEAARIQTPDTPLVTARDLPATDRVPGQFEIFLSSMHQTLVRDTRVVAKKGDLIFDAFWDIYYLGEKMGTFRVGYSRQDLIEHLRVVMGVILGTGCLVMLVTLGMIYWVIRRYARPLKTFTSRLSMIHGADQGLELKQRLERLELGDDSFEVEEIRNLKQAFSKLRTMFIANWDQLEAHRINLEKMVAERTTALNMTNRKLKQQIEERKEIESRLLTVQKMEAIGTLAGGIAHEFNNLFMAITGNAALIQKRCEPGHPNIQKAEKICELVETGSQSIQQLLGFARSGKYDPGPLIINDILRTGLGMFSKSRKDLAVETDFCRGLWQVHADRSQMEHVIMNLLLNASDAMPDKGRIRVKTCNLVLENKQVAPEKTVSGEFVMFCITDDGKGISSHLLNRVFDPFFTTKQMGVGTGLGLASVFGIAENHGGFVTADSRPGEGSEFCVFLPAWKSS